MLLYVLSSVPGNSHALSHLIAQMLVFISYFTVKEAETMANVSKVTLRFDCKVYMIISTH